MKNKVNKITIYLVIVLIVSAGFYTGSVFLGSAHDKQSISATFGDTVQGTIKARFGTEFNNQITIKLFITVGSIGYFIFSSGLWSIPATTKDGYATGGLTAADPNNNNITLVLEEAGSYAIWIESPYIEMTIEITVINEMLALSLAISGLVSISLITSWLIMRTRKRT